VWTSARNQCKFLSHIDVGIVVIVVPVSVATFMLAFMLGVGVMAALAKAISYKICKSKEEKEEKVKNVPPTHADMPPDTAIPIIGTECATPHLVSDCD